MSNFNEKDHPRDGDGKFIDKNAPKMQRSDQFGNPIGDTPAERQRANQILGDSTVDYLRQKYPKGFKPKTPKSQEEFYGKEFKGVKGQQAVELLLKERQGHVKGAFYIPELPSYDKDGNVDLVWGDSSGGLQHLIERRDMYKVSGVGTISGIEMAHKIADIMENGKFAVDMNGRGYIEKDGFKVGLKFNYLGNRATWIVTAVEIF